MTKYTSISIPVELFEQVNQIIEQKEELGYRKPTEFIKEAIRFYVYYIRDRDQLKSKIESFDKFQRSQK